MKLSATFNTLILLAALSLPAAPALAVYTQEASTFSAGGGISNSSNYENLGVIGQPGIVGTSTGGAYTANHGFLSVLGDGFKILYPVIAVDKASITFTLASGASGSDSLTISNSGGSTLNWSIAKGSSWLTTTPASGSGPLAVSISASTSDLTASTTPYTDTLTISGAGIDQTVQVLLSLTVTAPLTYHLTVTVLSDHATKGGGIVAGGSGAINCSNTGNPGSMLGTCQANLTAGSSITLSQYPDSNSTLATWSGACSGTGNCGVANIAANTAVTATFPYSSMARVASLSAPANGFESLVSAYGAAASTDTINTRAVPFTEGAAGSLVTLSGKTINLVGGLDAYYSPTIGFTTIQNVLKISSGRLNIKGGVKVHP
jgi:hypothetical protein